MQITETRKAIIELIEPYMDKTLSEWCLVKTNIKNYKFTKVLFHWYQTTDYTGRQFEYILCINWNKTKIISKWKIIWHYDITAVLKYIWKSNWIINWKYSLHFDDENNFINEKSTSKVFKIPSKPLYLYTEQEDKNLLELLKKLWTT